MSDIIKKEGGDLLDILHETKGIDLPKPFEIEIYLFDSFIAGTTHIENIKELASTIRIGDHLQFYREPDNLYDPQAIKIENSSGDKLGYIPRQDNIIFSRLMDAGKLLFGKVTSLEWVEEWLRVGIGIFLKE